MHRKKINGYLLFTLLLLYLSNSGAQIRIAILDYELKDMTLKPGIPAELARTASIRPLLEQQLTVAGYEVINIPYTAQQQANSGIGYLFDHHDTAAKLGRQHGADYIVVGRLHKPSFLFVYLLSHLIDANNGRLIGNFVTESKGGDKKLTGKAVEALTVEIDARLDRYTPPATIPKPVH
jgi:uncharacterized protein DUF2380